MLLSKKFLVLRLQLLGKKPTKLRNTKLSMLESAHLVLQSWNVCNLRFILCIFWTNLILLKSGMHSVSHIHRNLNTYINIQFFWDWKIMFSSNVGQKTKAPLFPLGKKSFNVYPRDKNKWIYLLPVLIETNFIFVISNYLFHCAAVIYLIIAWLVSKLNCPLEENDNPKNNERFFFYLFSKLTLFFSRK